MKKFLLLNFVLISLLFGSCKIVNIVEKPTETSKEIKKYDLIELFVDGYANVSYKGKWGRIDTTGKEIIPTIYDAISNIDNESYSIIHQNGKAGVISNDGQVKIKPSFDEMHYTKSMRFIVNVAGLWGVVDEYGQEIIANQFDEILIGLDDYSMVIKNNKYGLVNIETGELILPCIYDEIRENPNEPYQTFILKNEGKFGVFDVEKRMEIIPCSYKNLEPLSARFFQFNVEKIDTSGWEQLFSGVVNNKNEEIIPAEFESIDFYEGDEIFVGVEHETWKRSIYTSNGKLITEVDSYQDRDTEDEYLYYQGLLAVSTSEKWSFITKEGRPISDKVYDGTYGFWNDGYARICVGCRTVDLFDEKKIIEGKWGFINYKGEEVVPPKYNYVNDLYFDRATVNDSCHFRPDDLDWPYACFEGNKGVVNFKGEEIIKPKYDGVILMEDGFVAVNIGCENNMAIAAVHMQGKLGLFDSLGKEICPIIYDDIYHVDTENIFIVSKDGKSALMDYSGNLKSNLKYKAIDFLGDGLFIASETSTFNEEGGWKVIDGNDKPIFNTSFEIIYSTQNTFNFKNTDNFIVKKNGKWGIISGSESIILPVTYDTVEYYYNFMIIGQNNKFALADANGKFLTQFDFDQLMYSYQHLLPAKKDGKIGAINTKGEVIIPIEYESENYIFGNEFFMINKESSLYHQD